MTALTDQIAVAFRDYITAGVPASGNYKPTKADTRDILTTMATGAQWITDIQTFLNAATTAAARTGIGLGTGDSPTFTGATLTNITVDTSLLKITGSNNRVGIGTATPSADNTLEVALASSFTSTVALGGATTVTATMAMTGSGKLVVGNATTPTVGSLAGAETLAVTGTGNGASGSISRFTNDSSGSRLTLYKSRGTSIGTQTVVQNSDVLGDVRFNGADGTTYGEGARLSAIVDATPGSGSMPAALSFWTTPQLSVTSSERGRFTSSGNFLIGATSVQSLAGSTAQVQFHGLTQDASSSVNALWSNNSSGTYSRYFKSRGTSVGSFTVVQSGDTLGTLSWAGADGAAAVQAGAIYAQVDGTPSSSDMPGRIILATTADGASSVTERMRIDSAGLISFGDTDTGIQSGATDAIPFKAGGSEKMRLTTAGLAINHTSTISQGVTPVLQANGGGGIGTIRWSNDASGANITISKSRSTTVGTVGTIVQSGDGVGQIIWTADDGVAFRNVAMVSAAVDGTPGADDMPGRLLFSTVADGSTSFAERMRITSAGVVRPGTDNTQTLGDASFRWSVVYAGTGTINTSDARDKEWGGDLSAQEYRAAEIIAAKVGTFKWKDAINAKGWYAARKHIGVKAQDVEAAFREVGLNPGDYALWTNTPLTERKVVDGVDRDEPVLGDDGKQVTRQGIRPDQLALFILSAGLRQIGEIRSKLPN